HGKELRRNQEGNAASGRPFQRPQRHGCPTASQEKVPLQAADQAGIGTPVLSVQSTISPSTCPSAWLDASTAASIELTEACAQWPLSKSPRIPWRAVVRSFAWMRTTATGAPSGVS